MISNKTRKALIGFQRNEISEFLIYSRLAKLCSGPNSKVLASIADDEKRHYSEWKKYTLADVKPDNFKVWKYTTISKIFGLTFGIKLMESGEKGAQKAYSLIEKEVPAAKQIFAEEMMHEKKLISMIDEDMLKYVGSIVLGLNDALVELTGALAGLTMALQNTKLIAFAGSITGIAASLSMAASEYISRKTGSEENPLRAAVYTGIAYVLTVIVLVAPFLFIGNQFLALGITLASAIAIIAVFNYYISIAKDMKFTRRFLEMASISLGVAGITFLITYLIKVFFGLQI
jgi:vacuolar iron transporter family protein